MCSFIYMYNVCPRDGVFSFSCKVASLEILKKDRGVSQIFSLLLYVKCNEYTFHDSFEMAGILRCILKIMATFYERLI